MLNRFGFIILVAVFLVATTVHAQVGTQAPQVSLTVGQVIGEGLQWDILEYEGSPVQWGLWGLWGRCIGTCGIGRQRRQRTCYGATTIILEENLGRQVVSDPTGLPSPGARQGVATFQGTGCFGYTIEARGCQLQACTPIYGNWLQWGFCTATCGGGTRSRSRACLGNSQCDPTNLVETQRCNIQPCIVVPVWDSWSDWGACSVPCGSGTQTRSRNCLSGSCPLIGASDTRQCNTQACAPQWGFWLEWNACSVTCGGGSQARSRPCLTGNCSPFGAIERRECNAIPCQTIGIWSQWSQYSSCTATCGDGTKTRTRVCIGSRNCPAGFDRDTTDCFIEECTGTWGIWSTYSLCNRECGGGTRVRTRVCSKAGSCPGNGFETENCNEQPCVAYVWDQWQEFGRCSALCGQGTYTRSRICLRNGVPTDDVGGCIEAGGDETETQLCLGPACVSWASWGVWQGCSAACGPGTEIRTRICLANGQEAPAASCSSIGSPIQERNCDVGPCYAFGRWGGWGICSAACGPGTQIRTRPCLSNGRPINVLPNQGCGALDGPLTESRACIVQPCYSFGRWGDWGICSATCGRGIQVRSRPCLGDGDFVTLLPNQGCGTLDGLLTESRACNVQSCYTIGRWGDWGICSAPCGPGTQIRTRPCLANGRPVSLLPNEGCGELIDPLTESRACIVQPCYAFGRWGDWGGCSAACGGGIEIRSRQCLGDGNIVNVLPNQRCGTLDGPLTESRACNVQSCYAFGRWGDWGTCSAPCGPGTQVRTRPCLSDGRPVDLLPNQGCGTLNGPLAESRACIVQPCCAFGRWGDWGVCSATCGRGTQVRLRSCLADGKIQNLLPNQGCCRLNGLLAESRACITQACYKWSSWSSYTQCSATCGEGQFRRSRACVDDDGTVAPDTSACPDPLNMGSVEIRACRLAPCYSWQSWSQSSCSVTCGLGVATRTRRCTTRDGAPALSDDACPDPSNTGSFYTEPCRLGPCFSWSAWSEYSACSTSCGAGEQFRSRRCVALGGVNAPDITLCEDASKEGATQSIPCSGGRCFRPGPWASWSRCSSSCGQGTITRVRSCQSFSGVSAPNSACVGYVDTDFIIRGTCIRPPCRGNFGPWTSWGTCSRSCNSGTKLRTRTCDGGNCFGIDRDLEACNEIPCGVNRITGSWSVWSRWTPCTTDCGGTRTRTRTCVGGDRPSDCGREDYVQTITCTDCKLSGETFKDASCTVDNANKIRCQVDEIPPEVCLAIDCCYDNRFISEGVPACYRQG